MCTCVFAGLYNLTGDYMSSTELMSKSTGSAGGLTQGSTESDVRSTGEGGGLKRKRQNGAVKMCLMHVCTFF